jgi:hypothetical protein
MSISKETTIWCDCDGCVIWERLSLPPRKARKELIKYGWKRIKNKDVCPSCVGKMLEITMTTTNIDDKLVVINKNEIPKDNK